MNTEFIFKTNYFNDPWTWITRIAQFVIAITVLYLVDLKELQPNADILTVGYFIVAILGFALFVSPTDELALDKTHLYFIRKSIVPVFNRIIKCEISGIKGVGIYDMSHVAG